LLWQKKIEPNTVINLVLGSCFLAAAFMCSTILGFADAEGLTSLNVLLWRI
jgi:hypothetical protein